ncbi:hypothetical protein Tco_0196616 [Tanacetum coccineum]
MWNCAMKFAMRNNNKLGFIYGTCKRDSNNHAMANKWDMCNSVVVTWILGSLSPKQYAGQIYYKSGLDMWNDLKETYDKVDGSFDAMISLPACACDAAKHFEKHNYNPSMALTNKQILKLMSLLNEKFVPTANANMLGEHKEDHRNVRSG